MLGLEEGVGDSSFLLRANEKGGKDIQEQSIYLPQILSGSLSGSMMKFTYHKTRLLDNDFSSTNTEFLFLKISLFVYERQKTVETTRLDWSKRKSAIRDNFTSKSHIYPLRLPLSPIERGQLEKTEDASLLTWGKTLSSGCDLIYVHEITGVEILKATLFTECLLCANHCFCRGLKYTRGLLPVLMELNTWLRTPVRRGLAWWLESKESVCNEED